MSDTKKALASLAIALWLAVAGLSAACIWTAGTLSTRLAQTAILVAVAAVVVTAAAESAR